MILGLVCFCLLFNRFFTVGLMLIFLDYKPFGFFMILISLLVTYVKTFKDEK